MEIDKEPIDELLADCQGPEDLIGEQGLLKQLTTAPGGASHAGGDHPSLGVCQERCGRARQGNSRN